MSDAKDIIAWERAYLAQYRQAALGRLLSGFIHNINGPLQAFSMQVELFKWMFGQANVILARMAEETEKETLRESVAELGKLLDSRAKMMERLQNEIEMCKKTMQQIVCMEVPGETIGQTITINSIVEEEMFFLNADMFYKHKVRKEVNLSPSAVPLQSGVPELHQALFILLENAVEATRDSQERRLRVATLEQEGRMVVVVENTGTEIPAEHRERIFEPFFTTRAGHAGLGLYLAKKILQEIGGRITCESGSERTRFFLSLPIVPLIVSRSV